MSEEQEGERGRCLFIKHENCVCFVRNEEKRNENQTNKETKKDGKRR